jgi:uncharacterized protein (TIGR00251 family)
LIVKVAVKTDMAEESVEEMGENRYLVKLKAPRRKGKANAALLKLLSTHFNRKARIVSGLTSKNKIVELE